jgi:hypothetical protein
MNPMAGPTFDAQKAFDAEKAALASMDHEWAMEEAEADAAELLVSLAGGAKAA